jgi:hypothetical protein
LRALEGNVDQGLTRAGAELSPGHGYLQARAGLVHDWGRGLDWRADLEAGWNLGKGHSLFGTAYVQPQDVGVGVGYRWSW